MRVQKETEAIDAQRGYLAPRGFISRFSPDLPEWIEFDGHVEEFDRRELGIDPRSKHVRHIYEKDRKIIFDRIHLDDPLSRLRGVLSVFRIWIQETDRYEFAFTFETVIDPPPVDRPWKVTWEQIASAIEGAGLARDPRSASLMPVFWVVRETLTIRTLSDFVSRLKKFSEDWPMVYDTDAALRSIVFHGQGPWP